MVKNKSKKKSNKQKRSENIKAYVDSLNIPVPSDLSDDWEYNEVLDNDLTYVSNENFESTSIASTLDELEGLIGDSETEIEYSTTEKIEHICDNVNDIYEYIHKLRNDYMSNQGAAKLRSYALVRLTNAILSSNFFDIFGIDHVQTMEFNDVIIHNLVNIILHNSEITVMAIINKIIKHTFIDDMEVELGDGSTLTLPMSSRKTIVSTLSKLVKAASTTDLTKMYVDLEIDLYDLYVAKICLDQSITITEYEEDYDSYVDMAYDHIVRSFNLTKLDENFIVINLADLHVIFDHIKDRLSNI